MEKRCIFHVPYYVDINWPSGSNIRPVKMIDAFKNIGYEVDVVSGYGEERKKKIDEIKKKIAGGAKYSFVYSESSTAPTLLTEKNHIPTYPFLDFGFLKFCKSRGMKIGLFYRDVYWRFDVYKESVGLLKRIPAVTLYKYDLHMYKKLIDVFYLPSNRMYDYIPFDFKGKIAELPPAINEVDNTVNTSEGNSLNIFYVGGISNLYNIEKVFEAVNAVNGINLTVCCRQGEWDASKHIYSKYLNDRIKIVHESGKDLEPHFKGTDVFSLYFEPVEYRKFAMPVKLFEYIGYQKPIISTNGTATGDFVKQNDIGWSIDYSTEELIKLLENIKNNRSVLESKVVNIKSILNENTWEARARKVERDLI